MTQKTRPDCAAETLLQQHSYKTRHKLLPLTPFLILWIFLAFLLFRSNHHACLFVLDSSTRADIDAPVSLQLSSIFLFDYADIEALSSGSEDYFLARFDIQTDNAFSQDQSRYEMQTVQGLRSKPLENLYESIYHPLPSEFDAPSLMPNIRDKQTVLRLAIMSNNAYELPDSRYWIPLSDNSMPFHYTTHYWDKNFTFGFNSTGLRGHVFTSNNNQIAVVALKGTSPSLFGVGAPTGDNDRFNDNLMFSCCCGKSTSLARPVCDCKKGYMFPGAKRVCFKECLLRSARLETSYYNAARIMYYHIRKLYPSHQIWFVGHSLGGALASMMSLTTGHPAVAFESPGDVLYAKRLGFQFHNQNCNNGTESLISDSSDCSATANVYHFGNNLDPIFSGTCSSGLNLCGAVGFSIESKCHIGHKCVYQLDGIPDLRLHKISDVINKVIDKTDQPPISTQKNIIAFLDTGSGKTLISVLLCQHFSKPLVEIDTATLDKIQSGLGDLEILYGQKYRLDRAISTQNQGKLDGPGDHQVPTDHAASADPTDLQEKLASLVKVIKENEFQLKEMLPPQPRKVYFLVPTIPLVHQQALSIQNDTDLSVGTFSSGFESHSLGLDYFQFVKTISQYQVLVMTPFLFLNALRHGFVSMDGVSLVIFDECHHATKNHPYNCIMREYYIPIKNEPFRYLPRIFGMTASPISSFISTQSASLEKLLEIQANLCSTVVTVKDRSQLNQFVGKAFEKIMEYEKPWQLFSSTDSFQIKVQTRTVYSDFLQSQIIRLIRMHNAACDQTSAEKIRKMINNCVEVANTLGVWCAALLTFTSANSVLKSAMRQRNRQKSTSPKKHVFFIDDDAKVDDSCQEDEHSTTLDVPKLNTNWAFDTAEKDDVENAPANSKFISMNYEETGPAAHFPKEPVTPHDLSSKLRRLCDILQEKSSTERRTIVFVERRTTAKMIADFITRHHSRFPDIKCSHVTGSGSTGIPLSNITTDVYAQKRVFDSFGFGKVNTLIVTSVAEEGLDIPACNLVVIFDMFRNGTSYVQSRGRARNMDSTYVVMVEKGNSQHIHMIAQTKVSELMIKNLVADVSEANSAHDKFQSLERSDTLNDDVVVEKLLGNNEDEELVVGSTGAKISKYSAVQILSQYCSSLPHDRYTPQSRLVFTPIESEESWGYAFATTLSPSSPIGCRRFEGPVRLNIKLAQASLALKICKLLYETGGLNDHLFSGLSKSNRFKRGHDEDRKPVTIANIDPKSLEVIDDDDLNVQKIQIIVPEVLSRQHWSQLTKYKEPYELDAVVEWTKLSDRGSVYEYVHKESECLPETKVSLYAYKIQLTSKADEKYRQFAILVGKPLPRIPQFSIYPNEQVQVDLVPFGGEDGLVDFDEEQWTLCRDFQAAFFAIVMRKNTDKFVPDEETTNDSFPNELLQFSNPEEERLFKLIPITLEDVSIDWEFMTAVCSFTLGSNTLSDPFEEETIKDRIVVTLYNNVKYIGSSVRSDLTPKSIMPGEVADCAEEAQDEGKETAPASEQSEKTAPLTFVDSYRQKYGIEIVNTDCSLIQVRNTSTFKNLLVKKRAKSKPSKIQLILIPELCQLLPLSANDWNSGLLLPSLLFKIESLLLVEQLQRILNLHTISLNDLYMACCASAFQEPFDNERLETLGDSVLKFVVTADLFVTYTTADEDMLTKKRVKVISNRYLREQFMSRGLASYIFSVRFFPRQWAPPEIKSWKPRRTTDNMAHMRGRYKEIGNKVIADFVEALIGACYWHGGGLTDSIRFIKDLGCITSETWSLPMNPLLETIGESSLDMSNILQLEQKLGYSFRRKSMLLEAVTHASYIHGASQSYQRLEFLGDAVLDFVVTRYIFGKFPTLAPGPLSDLKQAAVSNVSFSRVCIENDLYKFLLHSSDKLRREIDDFVSWYLDGHVEDSPNEIMREGPKVLGDLLESITGAVFVDSGFDVESTWESISRLILPFIDKHCTMEAFRDHPVRQFFESANKLGYSQDSVKMSVKSIGLEYQCDISLDGSVICSARGSAKNYVKKMATTEALKKLQEKKIAQ